MIPPTAGGDAERRSSRDVESSGRYRARLRHRRADGRDAARFFGVLADRRVGAGGLAQGVGQPLGLAGLQARDHHHPVADGRLNDGDRQHAPVPDDGERAPDRGLGERGERGRGVAREPERQCRGAVAVHLQAHRLDARRREVEHDRPDPHRIVGGRRDRLTAHPGGVAQRVGRDGRMDSEPLRGGWSERAAGREGEEHAHVTPGRRAPTRPAACGRGGRRAP